jgi:hypothetical protein
MNDLLAVIKHPVPGKEFTTLQQQLWNDVEAFTKPDMLRREQIEKERQKTASKIPQIESQILQRVFHKIQKSQFDNSGTNTDWK